MYIRAWYEGNTFTINYLQIRYKIRHNAHFSLKYLEIVENTSAQYTRQTKKDAMTSGCLDRKEVRGAIWGVHSTTDRPAGGNTGRLFLAFGGPVWADRISICPLDRMY